MKNQIIFLMAIFLFCQAGFSYTTYYNDRYYNNYPNYRPRIINYPNYAPYNFVPNYYVNSAQYNYQRANQIQMSRLKKRQMLKKLNRRMNRYVTWNFNKNNGALTGYSLPVSKNDIKSLSSSPTCNMELWKNDDSNKGSYKDSLFNKNNDVYDKKTGAKTGVTIIYD